MRIFKYLAPIRNQGFGKNGSAAAQALHDMGGRVVGVSSSDTAIVNEVMMSGRREFSLLSFPKVGPQAHDVCNSLYRTRRNPWM
jgi:hypothetical protein